MTIIAAGIYRDGRLLSEVDAATATPKLEAKYETLLDSSAGPRMGSFIALYGVENSRRLIGEALA